MGRVSGGKESEKGVGGEVKTAGRVIGHGVEGAREVEHRRGQGRIPVVDGADAQQIRHHGVYRRRLPERPADGGGVVGAGGWSPPVEPRAHKGKAHLMENQRRQLKVRIGDTPLRVRPADQIICDVLWPLQAPHKIVSVAVGVEPHASRPESGRITKAHVGGQPVHHLG